MTREQLRASLDLHERRAARAHHNHKQHPRGSERYGFWVAAEREAERMVKVRRGQLNIDSRPAATASVGGAPRIVGWDVTKITPRNVFGALGPELKVTTHYAASPRARNLEEGIALTRQFDAFHRKFKGAGGEPAGLSYHVLFPDTGEIILGRSLFHKGAGVAFTNSNNVHANFFCTTGHQPTKAQAESFMWWLQFGHTPAMPASHRSDRDLRRADIRGHNQWDRQSTSCPGLFTPQNLRRIAA